MARMARTTGSTAQATEARLRAAALHLFARHGYAAVSMRQIAAEVGVQAGALYQYTPDKQSLLRDLMERHLTELLAAWAREAPQGAAIARLEGFARFHIRYHRDRVDAVQVAYMELRNLSPENHARIAQLRGRYEGALRAILAEGRFDLPDPDLASRAIIALLTGVTSWYRESGKLSAAEIEDHYWLLVRRAVGA